MTAKELTRATLSILRHRGLSSREIGERTGFTTAQIHKRMQKHSLTIWDTDFTTAAEIASEGGVLVYEVRKRALLMGFPVRRYASNAVFTRAEATQLRAYYAEIAPLADYAHFLSAEAYGRELGVSGVTVHAAAAEGENPRFRWGRSIRRVKVRAPELKRWAWRYDPATLPAVRLERAYLNKREL